MINSIKVLLFDVDGTLLNFLAAEKAAIFDCFKLFNLGPCDDELISRYSKINIKYWKKLERGESTRAQILKDRLVEFFNQENIQFSDYDAFNQEYQILLGNTICFNDDSLNIIKKLSKTYDLYVVTNGSKVAQDRKLRDSGLISYFKGVFISETIGAEKPSKEYFDIVLSKIKHDKNEIMIIGDSLTSDIAGGFNTGIKTCWYNPNNLPNDKSLKIDYIISDLHELNNIL